MSDISSLSMHTSDLLAAGYVELEKELTPTESFLKKIKEGVAANLTTNSEASSASLTCSNLATRTIQQTSEPNLTLTTLQADFAEAKKVHNDRIKKLEKWHHIINDDIKNFNHLSILNLFSLIPDRNDPIHYNEFVLQANADCRFTKILTASSSFIFYTLKLFYTLLTKFTVLRPLERRLQAIGMLHDDHHIGLKTWQEELKNNWCKSGIKITEKLEKLHRKLAPRNVDWTFLEFFPEDVTTAQQIMSKRFRHALNSISQTFKISGINQAREHQRKWIVALQSSEQSAEEQKAYFEKRVQENVENFIKPRLLKWQSMSFDEIQKDCVLVGIKLAALKQPPQNKSEWLNATDTEEFQLELAEQHVKHAHLLGKLVEQVARNALLSKHQIERNAFYWSRLEKYLKITLCIFKVILSFPLNLPSSLEPLIFTLFNDAVKDGIPLTKKHLPMLGYIYVINPSVNLKIIDIVACPILKYLGNASNKPHEYSFEGHKIAFKKESTNLYIWAYQKIIELLQCLIGLGKILIDNYIPGVSLQAVEANPFVAHFERGLKQEYANSKKWIQSFDDQLELLRLKDAQLIFKPQTKLATNFSEDPLQEIADMIKARGIEVDDSDPLQILGQALSNIDPNYIAESTEEFFTTHIKIWPKKNRFLNQEVDKIFIDKTPQLKLTEAFVSKGKKFVRLYTPAAAA